MTSQPNDGSRYTQYVTITILTCLVAQSIGLLLGAVAPNVPVSSILNNKFLLDHIHSLVHVQKLAYVNRAACPKVEKYSIYENSKYRIMIYLFHNIRIIQL